MFKKMTLQEIMCLQMTIDWRTGKKFRITCGSKYFELKYGDPSPVIEIGMESQLITHRPFFIRAVCLLKGRIYYGHIKGIGEFVHESELGPLGGAE